MKKLLNFLNSKIKYILFIYVLVQITLIIIIEPNYGTDAKYYYKLAQDCIKQNEFYPTHQDLYEDYIFAPLYVNTLIVLLTIYNSPLVISFFNLATILLQILLLYKITLRIFSRDIAHFALLLFIIYLNNLALMLQNYTELFFLLLISSAIYLYLLNKPFPLLLSGILLGCAIAVRPLGWALLLAFISVQIYKSIKTKKFKFEYFYIYLGTIVFIVLFGSFIYSQFGRFEYTSTTGPVNLLIGANDDATGAFHSKVFGPGKEGYLENSDSLTYLQKGKFYQEKAINWISENPVKWILLVPLKFLHTYGCDDVSLTNMFGLQDTNFLKVMRIIFEEGDFNKALPNTTLFNKVFYLTILILSHFYYYFLLIAIVLGIFQLFKTKSNIDSIRIIQLFIFFATLMIMITVGTPRYKYPMFILLLPFAAYYIEMKFKIGDHKLGNQ